MYRQNKLKQRLAAGGRALGCFSTLGNPEISEILALAGFDFVVIDQEHGLGGPHNLMGHLRAMSATEATSVVRVPWNDPIYLKRVLDDGVEAVMVPSVNTAEEARAVVDACWYPPAGRRGAFGGARASDYGLAIGDYVDTAADNLLIICQIETATAVENVDEIAAVEGVDVLFIGPRDLSASIGRLGQFDHPELADLVARAEDGIRRAGKMMGIIPYAQYSWSDQFERGYQVVAAGSEVSRLVASIRPEIDAHRAANG